MREVIRQGRDCGTACPSARLGSSAVTIRHIPEGVHVEANGPSTSHSAVVGRSGVMLDSFEYDSSYVLLNRRLPVTRDLVGFCPMPLPAGSPPLSPLLVDVEILLWCVMVLL